MVVQLGDVMDRGDHEIGERCCAWPGSPEAHLTWMLLTALVKLLRDLDEQARKVGGAVYMLNGNHESLNICGDFR